MAFGNIKSVSFDLSRMIPIPAVSSDLVLETALFKCDHQDPPDFIWRNPAGMWNFLRLFTQC
jgi:hypothetical protein